MARNPEKKNVTLALSPEVHQAIQDIRFRERFERVGHVVEALILEGLKARGIVVSDDTETPATAEASAAPAKGK